MNKLPDFLKRHTAVCIQETKVADLHEPCGKHMLEKAPDEFKSIQGNHLPLSGMLVLERNRMIIPTDDSMIGDSHPEHVPRKIPDSGLATANGLAIYHPHLMPDGRVNGSQEPGFIHGVTEFSSEDFGKRFGVDKEILTGGQPALAIPGQRAPRHYQMQVWMVLKLSAPGMQGPKHADAERADKPFIIGQLLQGLIGA